MQMIKNAKTLGGVHTHTHTHTGDFKNEKRIEKATQINLKM